MRMVQDSTLSSPSYPPPHYHQLKEQPVPPRFKGVRYRSWGRWVSEIRLPRSRERVWLGSFATAEMASRAFEAASIALHGSPPSPDHGRRRRHRAAGPQPGFGTPAQRRLFKDKIRAIATAAASSSSSTKPSGAALSNISAQFRCEMYPKPNTNLSRNSSPGIEYDEDEVDSDTKVPMWNHHWVMNGSPGSEEESSDSYSDSSSSSQDSAVQNEWAGLEELDGTWHLEQDISMSQRSGADLWEADLRILRELEQDLASNSI